MTAMAADSVAVKTPPTTPTTTISTASSAQIYFPICLIKFTKEKGAPFG